jgi:UDP-glucose 4-epimerase
MLHVLEATPRGFHVHNLGTDEHVTVNESIGVITRFLNLQPKLTYTGGQRGWIGDSPFIFLDTARVRATGWVPKLNIHAAVEKTIAWLSANPHVLERQV